MVVINCSLFGCCNAGTKLVYDYADGKLVAFPMCEKCAETWESKE